MHVLAGSGCLATYFFFLFVVNYFHVTHTCYGSDNIRPNCANIRQNEPLFMYPTTTTTTSSYYPLKCFKKAFLG